MKSIRLSVGRSVGDVVVVSQRWKRLMPTRGGAEQNVNKNTMTPAEPRRASCCLFLCLFSVIRQLWRAVSEEIVDYDTTIHSCIMVARHHHHHRTTRRKRMKMKTMMMDKTIHQQKFRK